MSSLLTTGTCKIRLVELIKEAYGCYTSFPTFKSPDRSTDRQEL